MSTPTQAGLPHAAERNEGPPVSGTGPLAYAAIGGADEQLLAVIVENMFAGVQITRASDASILYANPRFVKMFGYESGELEGKPVSVLNAPGGRTPEDVAREIITAVRRDGVWQGELENIRKDGTRFWCEARVTTFDHPRHGALWVTVQLDVTPRRLAEEALRRSEERLSLILEATGSGGWDWNLRTGEVEFSRYWIESLGYSVDEVPRHVGFWEGLVHPRDLPRVREALARHFDGTTPVYECVTRLRRKDGSWRWNVDRGRIVERDVDGAPLRMVGTDTDLSQQRWSGLQEIVSICAGCKKLKGEGGSWQAIEAHFGERSLAQFSHGLCPDCFERYSAG